MRKNDAPENTYGAGLTEKDDRALALAAQSGDTEAFAALLRRYEKTVYRTCYLVTGNAEDAEDLTQEVFLRVWSGIGSYRGESKFFTWLYAVTKHVCTDRVRKNSHTPKAVSLTPPDDGEEYAAPEPRDTDRQSAPDEALCAKETQAAVRAAIVSLKDEYRVIVLLRDIEGHSYEEISVMLGIGVGTVKSRLNRAREALKKKLSKTELF